MRDLNPKQFNIANGPQGQRWDNGMIRADDRWFNQAEREHGKAYMDDVEATHVAAIFETEPTTPYYPGQGGPGTQVQGKLFHDPKPIDPHRWPRGYTPERQSDVAVSFSTFDRERYQEEQSVTDAVGARAKDAVARSDMPERDLSRMSKGYEDPVKIATQKRGGGTYHDRQRMITLHPEAGDNTTLHEVGHAVSARRGLPGRVGDEQVTRDWDEAARQGGTTFGRVAGAEEARADIYSRHTRRKDGTQDLRTSNYGLGDDYLRTMGVGSNGDPFNGENAFYEEYEAEHERQGIPTPSVLGRQMRDAASSAGRAALQAENAQVGQLLFRRISKDSEDPTPDYGQYGYTGPSGSEELGTIRSGRGVPPEITQSVADFEKRKREERGW